MARLDSYKGYPEGMDEYLSYYGWHFSKKMCEWAVSRMYRLVNDRPVKIDPIKKEQLDEILKRYSVRLKNDKGYDAVYVANMCKADYLGRSVKDEGAMVQFIVDTIEDPDGYEGMVLTRFYADCIGSGTPINWEDML